MAIVSPVTAADGAVGAVLAVLFLHEQLSIWQLSILAVIFLGIFCASTNLAEAREILRTTGIAGLAKGGVRWGLLAMLTFGVMLFGIGLSSSKWGWYAPIFWTRAFAALALLLVATWPRLRSRRSTIAGADLARRPNSMLMFGICLAAVVGLLETIGLLVYSFDTQLASTGLAAAISSSWGILPLAAGISIFHERLLAYQLFGVALVLTGLFLLAIKPT